MAESTKAIAKTALLITFAAACSKVFGFVREAVIGYVFGVGAVTDAYVIASRVVTTVGLLVMVYITTTFVPAYARIKEQHGDNEALTFTNNNLGISLTVNICLMFLIQLITPFLLRLTGFDAEQAGLAITAIRISLFQLPLLTFVNVFVGYLTARKNFLGPNMIGIPLSIGVIVISLIAGTGSGIAGLSLANLVGVLAQFLIFFIWLPKEKFRFKFSLRFNTPENKEGMRLLLPALIAYAVIDLRGWIDTIVATFLGEGNAAAIGFASRLITLVVGLVLLPVTGIFFSYASTYVAQKENKKMFDVLWRTVRIALFALFPVVAIGMPFAYDIIQIIFQRGQFTHEAVLLTGSALLWFLPSLLGTAVVVLLQRVYYALQDTKTPAVCIAISVAINIVLSLLLSRIMGIGGITLATTIGQCLQALLLLAFLRRKIGVLGFSKTATNIVKLWLCVIPCALVAIGVGCLFYGQHVILRFCAGAFAGGVVYLVMALLLKEMVLRDSIQYIKIYLKNRGACKFIK